MSSLRVRAAGGKNIFSDSVRACTMAHAGASKSGALLHFLVFHLVFQQAIVVTVIETVATCNLHFLIFQLVSRPFSWFFWMFFSLLLLTSSDNKDHPLARFKVALGVSERPSGPEAVSPKIRRGAQIRGTHPRILVGMHCDLNRCSNEN